jgi:hypothetical protein
MGSIQLFNMCWIGGSQGGNQDECAFVGWDTV